MVLSGDFAGGGAWTFAEEDGGTRAQLDWWPIVERPLVKYLTPVLRPLFRANHYWTMVRGQQHIVEYMRARGQLNETAAPAAETPAARAPLLGPAFAAALVLAPLGLARGSRRAALTAAGALALEAFPPYRRRLRSLADWAAAASGRGLR